MPKKRPTVDRDLLLRGDEIAIHLPGQNTKHDERTHRAIVIDPYGWSSREGFNPATCINRRFHRVFSKGQIAVAVNIRMTVIDEHGTIPVTWVPMVIRPNRIVEFWAKKRAREEKQEREEALRRKIYEEKRRRLNARADAVLEALALVGLLAQHHKTFKDEDIIEFTLDEAEKLVRVIITKLED